MGDKSHPITISDNDDVSPPPPKRRKVSFDSRINPKNNSGHQHALPSPIRLTRVKDLPDDQNRHAVSLPELLGDPLIVECWQFNFLFDLDFLMNCFDADVRRQVTVKIVHGSWKREDTNRIAIEQALPRWPNVEQVIAWLPGPFGTHHSKMMILFRNDDTAQVIIHTSNMIPTDWRNLTQAMWQSPQLPLTSANSSETDTSEPSEIGTGKRFKSDLLRYLKSYGPTKTKSLVDRLTRHDFEEVKAALIASSPGKVRTQSTKAVQETSWGWCGLREVLAQVDSCALTIQQMSPDPEVAEKMDEPRVVVQVSSIASLGNNETWLNNFWSVLSTTKTQDMPEPRHQIIYPTVAEVRDSLDGYMAGASIHMRIAKPSQKRQLEMLRPTLCRWTGPHSANCWWRKSGRRRAAPHIKTYIRFSGVGMTKIDWVMLTSANLSQQAWGKSEISGEMSIESYEIGVLLWPALYNDTESEATGLKAAMVPVFGTDEPSSGRPDASRVVGIRMPYDLPIQGYISGDVPWSPGESYDDVDWRGNTWTGS